MPVWFCIGCAVVLGERARGARGVRSCASVSVGGRGGLNGCQRPLRDPAATEAERTFEANFPVRRAPAKCRTRVKSVEEELLAGVSWSDEQIIRRWLVKAALHGSMD